MPARPRVQRRRRGEDLLANTRQALAPARRREVDLVVHGGDLLYRSKVPGALVERALEPLREVADAGVPVVLVPGNHERSRLPYPILAAHRHLHLFDRPRSLVLHLAGHDVRICGFPCVRNGIRSQFSEQLQRSLDGSDPAPINLLCLHQTVEGARVGPAGYTFRRGPDIIPGQALPGGVAAVLAGHIHRHQVLTRDLRGQSLPAPVFYPGSIERISFAEADEDKGYVVLELEPDLARGGRLVRWSFERLYARPMLRAQVVPAGPDTDAVLNAVQRVIDSAAPDAILQIEISGDASPVALAALGAARLRQLAPPSISLTVKRAAPNGTRVQ